LFASVTLQPAIGDAEKVNYQTVNLLTVPRKLKGWLFSLSDFPGGHSNLINRKIGKIMRDTIETGKR